MKTKKLIKALLGISFLTLGMVTVNDVKEVKEVNAAGSYVKVTDASTLASGDKVIIVASDYSFALSTKQNGNNRGQAAVVKDGDTVSFESDTQIITLEAGCVAGTFAFNVGDGYLYAASSTNNYLRTQSSNDANSSFKIEITDGKTSIVAQGTNTRNTMQYNLTNSLFACYAEDKPQKPLSIYKAPEGQPSISISSNASYTEVSGTVEFSSIIKNADDATVTYTSSDSTIASFNGNVLTGNKAGEVDVTASMVVSGTTYTSNPVSIKVWPKADSELTIAEANDLLNMFDDDDKTPYKYYIIGTINEITDGTNGSCVITDNTGTMPVYKLSDSTGKTKYADMESKPNVGDSCKLYGVLSTYAGAVQIYDAWVMEHQVQKAVYFSTSVELGFSAEYEIVTKNVQGSYEMVSADLGIANGADFESASSSDGIVKISGSKGNNANGNRPKYYTGGEAIRMYASNTITIVSSATISSVVVECVSNYVLPEDAAADSGTITISGTTATIESQENTNTIILTNTTAENKQVRITKITVNYGGSSSSYEFSNFGNYHLRFSSNVAVDDINRIIEEGESIEDLTFGALITPKSYMTASGYASFEAAYAENPNVNFEEVFAAKNVTANYVDGQFGIILNNIPTTDVEVCVVLYAQATDGTMYFVEQKTVSVKSVVTAYYNQINSLGLEEEQIEAVKALYAQVTAQA